VDVETLVIFLVIGAIAGWLAGLLMRGGGFGLLGRNTKSAAERIGLD
jgi:uncharacterized membrane protein YeaQ/YmgE (transglycosylase-associated protein family)